MRSVPMPSNDEFGNCSVHEHRGGGSGGNTIAFASCDGRPLAVRAGLVGRARTLDTAAIHAYVQKNALGGEDARDNQTAG